MSTTTTPPTPPATPPRELGTFEKLNKLRLSVSETQRGTIGEWTVTVLLLLFATTTLVQAFVIPTGSMEDTMLIGDHLLVDKLAYSPKGPVSQFLLPYEDVKRGDIIVFRYPEDIRQTFVKRAIGIPGDTIRIEEKQLFLNGHSVQEPYVQHIDQLVIAQRDNIAEFTVPGNSYFAMGDNRDNSHDSRFIGFVPRENIFGKPWLVYWSYDSTTENLSGSPLNPDHLKDLALNFFSKTRWSRTFQLVRGYPLQ